MGVAAEAAEKRKHTANDPKCAELGCMGVCASSSRIILQLG